MANKIPVKAIFTGADVTALGEFASTDTLAADRIDPTGTLTIDHIHATNGLVIDTAGQGIDFSINTHAAGMTSELLDWYEEGTWTIGVSFGGAAVDVTYNASYTTGRYTRIGRLVVVSGLLILTNKGSSTGAARFTGLPFAVSSGGQSYCSVSLRLKNVTFANQYIGYVEIGTTTIALEEVTEAGSITSLTDADFANDSEVMLNVAYTV